MAIRASRSAVWKVEDDGDTDDIIITGDNTKPTESLNAEEENTSEVEKSGENTSEVEKSGEDTGEAGRPRTPPRGRGQADEPTSQELLAPEDEEKQARRRTEQKPADSQEPEQDRKRPPIR